jgi:hypothetical protein
VGLFDHLFKPKSNPACEEQVEGARIPEPASAAGAAVNRPPHKPPVIAPPDAFGVRLLGQIVAPGRVGAPAQRSGLQLKPSSETKVAREIVLTLDDVLARIPKELLIESAHDGRRVLRFSIDNLSADIARGRAAVPLSQIAEQCPDIFHVPIGNDNDVLIRLPLQKLVEQIAPGGISTTPAREAAGESPDAKIHLSIAAILRRCPREIIVRELPPIAETERVTFPFAPIERQLPTGRVDVSSIRFVAALPLHMHEYFRAIEGVRVPLPLDEIFQNLPGLSAVAPSSASMPGSAPAPEPGPQSPPPGGVTFTPASASPFASPPASEAAPPVEPATVPKPPPSVKSMRLPGFTPASDPAPAPRAVEPPHTEPRATSSVPPRVTPQMDLAKHEIAELRARIAALKVEFNVPSVSPVATPHIKEEPSAEASPLLKSQPPAKTPPPLLEPAAAADQIPLQLAPLLAPVPFPATFGPQPNELPSLGIETPPPDATSEAAYASAPVFVAPDPQLDKPLASGPDPLPSLSPPESAFTSPPLPAAAAAPLPELFRPPLVPPPVAPVVVTTPRIEPPAPVMLPMRTVAPPPVRPHVAPPRLFTAGENVPLPEVHSLAPVVEPEPSAPSPPPPLPPLSLGHAYATLGIEGEQTLARVAEHLATLPGLSACVLDVRYEAAEAGVFPEGLNPENIRGLVAPLAAALAGRTDEHISIFGEHGSISIFARGEARLAILHRARVFLPGIREKLAAVTGTLANA